MKTVLSLQSQLDLAGLEGSSVTTFSMFFQVSILDMLCSATKCPQVTFWSHFGCLSGSLGGIDKLTVSIFVLALAVLGPKCLQELPQETP